MYLTTQPLKDFAGSHRNISGQKQSKIHHTVKAPTKLQMKK